MWKKMLNFLQALKLATFEEDDQVVQSVLHWACECKHIIVIQGLINKGVDLEKKLEEKNNDGKRPLQLAIENNFDKPEVVELLLDQGVKLEEDIKREVPHWACKRGHVKVVQQLIDKADFNLGEDDKRQVLHWACHWGHVKVVQQLINKGVNLEEKDERGRTLFQLAIEHYKYKPEVVELLLSQGVKIEEDDKRQFLYWACHWGQVKVIQQLINQGVNLEEMDEWGRTLETPLTLEIVIKNNLDKPEVVELLLKNLEEKNDVGKTLLEIAIENKFEKLEVV